MRYLMIRISEIFEDFLMLTLYMLLGILAMIAWAIPCIGIYYLIMYIKG